MEADLGIHNLMMLEVFVSCGYIILESGSFRPWVVSPGRFALGRFALVFGVSRFALIRWVILPVSRFARESFRPNIL